MSNKFHWGAGMFPMIQVAGIVDQEEARMLVDSRVTHLGFPLRLPIHREDLSEAQAAQIISNLPRHVHSVLITYLDRASELKELREYLGLGAIQIHGDIAVEELQQLRRQVPECFLIKSLVIEPNDQEGRLMLDDLERFQPWVDAFLTDTFDPVSGASGATGKTHDWHLSKKAVALSRKPIILAGGLNPANVALAIRTVQPAGVDAHTGLEGKDGRKDPQKVKDFVAQTTRAFKTWGNHS